MTSKTYIPKPFWIVLGRQGFIQRTFGHIKSHGFEYVGSSCWDLPGKNVQKKLLGLKPFATKNACDLTKLTSNIIPIQKKNWEFHLAQQSANGFKNVFGPKFFGFLWNQKDHGVLVPSTWPYTQLLQQTSINSRQPSPYHLIPQTLSKPPLFSWCFLTSLLTKTENSPKFRKV